MNISKGAEDTIDGTVGDSNCLFDFMYRNKQKNTKQLRLDFAFLLTVSLNPR